MREKLLKRAAVLKRDIPAVFLALRAKETPLTAKLLAALTVCCALSPMDLIPDFVPVLGYLDDLLVLPALVALTVRLIPAEVLSACRKEAEGMWRHGKPKRWYFAIPTVVIWALVVLLILRCIF